MDLLGNGVHERAGSLPPSARAEAVDQRLRLRQLQCPAKRPNNQNPVKILWCVSADCSQFIPGKTDRVWETKTKTNKNITHTEEQSTVAAMCGTILDFYCMQLYGM